MYIKRFQALNEYKRVQCSHKIKRLMQSLAPPCTGWLFTSRGYRKDRIVRDLVTARFTMASVLYRLSYMIRSKRHVCVFRVFFSDAIHNLDAISVRDSRPVVVLSNCASAKHSL
jgi:hypothetical protein